MKNQQNISHSIHPQEPELEAIKQLVADAEKYQKTPDSFSQLFTENAVIVNVAGVRLIGPAEINAFMKKAQASFLANILVKNEVEDVVFLRPDVAVVIATQYIYIKEGDDVRESDKGSLTFVMVKEQGIWKLAVGQNTLVKESPV